MAGGVLQELPPHDAGQTALVQAWGQPVRPPLNPEIGGGGAGVVAGVAEQQGVIGVHQLGFTPGDDGIGVVQGFATAAGAVPMPAHQTAGDHRHRIKGAYVPQCRTRLKAVSLTAHSLIGLESVLSLRLNKVEVAAFPEKVC